MKTIIEKIIQITGTQTELAARMSVKQQHVYAWIQRGRIPGDWVISASRATGYMVTPHQIRPDIYPHPDDGLPSHLRGKSGDWPDGVE